MKRSSTDPKTRQSFKDRRNLGKKIHDKKVEQTRDGPYTEGDYGTTSHSYVPTGKEKAANIN